MADRVTSHWVGEPGGMYVGGGFIHGWTLPLLSLSLVAMRPRIKNY